MFNLGRDGFRGLKSSLPAPVGRLSKRWSQPLHQGPWSDNRHKLEQEIGYKGKYSF